MYCKFPKSSDTQNICCNHSKILTMWLYHRVMSPNNADRMANSVDPDQTAPLGAVWYGSAMFAQAYLSENLGSLWYIHIYSQTCTKKPPKGYLKSGPLIKVVLLLSLNSGLIAENIGHLKRQIALYAAICCFSWKQNFFWKRKAKQLKRSFKQYIMHFINKFKIPVH